MAPLLFISILVISTCGLVYELLAGTASSYLLGDSVTQFSTVIGVYLFSMGIGSYLSRFIRKNFIPLFVEVELLIGLVGGTSAALHFILFDSVFSFRLIFYLIVLIIGLLVGLEIPLMMRILKNHLEFKDLVSKVFTFDYIGALVASLLFPLLLVPHLGLIRTSFLFGIFNVLVALWALFYFQNEIAGSRFIKGSAFFVLFFLISGFVYSDNILRWSESRLYSHPIVYATSSPYQRIVLTKGGDDLRLYLNGHLQFSSRDEYRYHESLVDVGMRALDQPENILVLGGGDGMAVREILKYSFVKNITLVDLDPRMTKLFTHNSLLTDLNNKALLSPRVSIVNADAFLWLKTNPKKFDFIVVDFPDPTSYSLGKLYTTHFFTLLDKSLGPQGVMAIQSTSPLFARKSFWCVNNTLQAAGFMTFPYHSYVPSFGEWGFILAGHTPLLFKNETTVPSRFITPEIMDSLFYFSPDMAFVPTEINRLNNQILVRYYEEEWERYEDEEET